MIRRLNRSAVVASWRGTIYKNGFASGLQTGQISQHRMPVTAKAGNLIIDYGHWGFGGGVLPANDLYVECAIVHPLNSNLIYRAILANGQRRATINPGCFTSFYTAVPGLPDGEYEIPVRTWYGTPSDGGDVPGEWSPVNTAGHERWRVNAAASSLLSTAITPAYPNDVYYSPVMLRSADTSTTTPVFVAMIDSNNATHDGLSSIEQAVALMDERVLAARLGVAGGGIQGYINIGTYGNKEAPPVFWRLAVMAGGTHAILDGYTNSLAETAATLIGWTEETIRYLALLGFEGVVVCTAPPHPNAFHEPGTPPAEQTIDTVSEPNRTVLNSRLRAHDFDSVLPYGIADGASAIEVNLAGELTLNGGYWLPEAMGEGTHLGTGGSTARAPIYAETMERLLDGETEFVVQANITPTVPVVTANPTISGSPVSGSTLTSTTGTATGYPTPTPTYQWRKAGVNIGGATSSTYQQVSGDIGSAITCRVTWTNSAGNATGTSNAITTTAAATAPGQPTSLGATAGNGQVALAWTQPASNGGASITDSVIEKSTNGGSSWTTVSHSALGTTAAYTVTGLSNDTAHLFRVAAVNSVGTGTPSATAAATPTAPVSGTIDGALGSKLHEWHTGDSLGSNASAITSWADGSGHSRVATEATNQPAVATVNGLKVARFDGTNDKLRCNYASLGGSLTAPYEVWMLSKMRSGPDPTLVKMMWSGYSVIYKWLTKATPDPTAVDLSATGGPLIADNVDLTYWQITRVLVKSGASLVQVDGATIASGDAGTGAYAGTSIGQGWSDEGTADIDIREYFVVNAETTGGERTALMAILEDLRDTLAA